MMDSLNEIDLVAFYTSSCVPSPTKMSTIHPVDIPELCPPTLESPLDLNDPAHSSQPGPPPSVLSDFLFEADLLKNRYFESNILVASENLVVESFTKMRESVRTEEESRFEEDLLENIEPMFNRTPKVGL
ncbi:hypothetical protein KY285_009099 [Solanum tuberosum]|nr:hypothetical protein KY285_009099 [Solanum tuberosum]